MAPLQQSNLTLVNLWGRRFPKHEIEKNTFKPGDHVYIFAGNNKRKTGVVEKVMTIMMLVKITEGTHTGGIIKCNLSSARKISVAEEVITDTLGQHVQHRTVGRIVELMTAMKEKYNENMKQLTTRMQQVKDEMIRQIALNSTEEH
jgi:ribosomal protein L24